MFYKVTWRNLIRSATFWLVLIVLGISVAYKSVISCQYEVYSQVYGEIIFDTDPRYILDYDTYLKVVLNNLNTILNPYLGIFAVATTAIVLTRDYKDHFFEIEKASNMSASKYLVSRVITLIAVIFSVLVLFHNTSVHAYVFSRGGVSNTELAHYFIDSSIRIFRSDLIFGLPYVVFYVCFTYSLGSIFKNGVYAAITGFSYALACMIFGMFFMSRYSKAIEFFQDYLKPSPMKVFWFLYDFDTEDFENTIAHFKTSSGTVAFCIIFLAGISMLYSLISYFRIRKRTV